MRALLLCAAAVLTAAPALGQQAWIAACQGGKDAQYVQTIGGDGHFNVPNADGTYASIPVKQSFDNGAIVCGTTGARGASQIAEVCADSNRNAIAVMSPAQMARHLPPEDATLYCNAEVSVH